MHGQNNINKYITHCIPSTSFGHTFGHLQGRKITNDNCPLKYTSLKMAT